MAATEAPDTKEIEVTPLMAEAGVLEWVKGRDWLESEEDVVARIFHAMLRANKANGPA
jgi:hypothetical protein